MRLVKLFLGGQTVTFGKSRSVMGRVSMVVEIGLWAQIAKDWWIRNPATVKPLRTTNIQNSLMSRLVVEMWDKPWMVEDSKKSLTPVSMLNDSSRQTKCCEDLSIFYCISPRKCPMFNIHIESLIEL